MEGGRIQGIVRHLRRAGQYRPVVDRRADRSGVAHIAVRPPHHFRGSRARAVSRGGADRAGIDREHRHRAGRDAGFRYAHVADGRVRLDRLGRRAGDHVFGARSNRRDAARSRFSHHRRTGLHVLCGHQRAVRRNHQASSNRKPGTGRTRMSKNPFPLPKEQLLEAYRIMRTIREFEERLHTDFARGDIPGFVHRYAGEEASAGGIMMHLTDKDRIASTHRGHGHCIAKGVNVKAMMAEIYGKATGACRGKGGSMHIADLSKGMMGANGILGAGAPLACGAALAAQKLGHKGVGISFVGDGASNQGMFLESLNLAAVWNLPAIFVVENNGYAESTSRDYAVAVDSYVDRAAGFGLPGVTVDGLDFFAVYEAAGEIIKRAREGGGPALLECKMIRMFGHFEGDQQTYRAKGEVDDIRANKDCIKMFADRVVEAGIIGRAELEAIDREAEAIIREAVAFAKSAALPSAADLINDVY